MYLKGKTGERRVVWCLGEVSGCFPGPESPVSEIDPQHSMGTSEMLNAPIVGWDGPLCALYPSRRFAWVSSPVPRNQLMREALGLAPWRQGD